MDGHRMVLEGNDPAMFHARFESIGVALPARRVTTQEVMASTRHRTRIDLERLTGIRARRWASDGQDSFSLAVDAARDCLARSGHTASDLDLVVSASISRFTGGLRQRLEPPLGMAVAQAIGASGAASLDISNACAGMLTGVFMLNDKIRRGEILRGMVVSGERISPLAVNAAAQIRTVLSR